MKPKPKPKSKKKVNSNSIVLKSGQFEFIAEGIKMPQHQAAESILGQFQPLFFFCKWMGIYPQNAEAFYNKHTLEKSKNGLWFVVTAMLVYVVLYNLLLFSFKEEDSALQAMQSTLTYVIGLFLTYIGLFMMMVDQLTALRNQSQLGELYERIRCVDERLLKERCVLNNRQLGLRVRFMLVLTIAFELSIVLLTYIKLVDYNQWMSLLWFIAVVPTFVNSLDKVWFAVSLYALKDRFEAINAALEEIVLMHEKYKAWVSGDEIGSEKVADVAAVRAISAHYGHNLEYLYKELGSLDISSLKGSGKNKIAPIAHSLNSFGETIVTPIKPQKLLEKPMIPIAYESELNNVAKVEDKLNHLCQVHDEICEIGKSLNEFWSYQILILMAYGFLIFTAQLYFYYCATQDQIIPSLFRSAKFLINTVLVITYTSGKCIYLIYLSWKTSLASKRTGISLHKIGVVADDNLLYEIVNHLSLKLLNHTVNFSACGFFTLDMETLYGVSGGITSYLIILIQFNLAAQQAKEAIQTFSSFNENSTVASATTQLYDMSSTQGIHAVMTSTITSITGY